MLGLHVLEKATGKFAHPRTFQPGARSIWDTVYGHLRKTAPEELFCKANLEGLRLLPKPMSLCWVIVRDGTAVDSPHVVRLLMLSGYSGERGGTQGMGYQILKHRKPIPHNPSSTTTSKLHSTESAPSPGHSSTRISSACPSSREATCSSSLPRAQARPTSPMQSPKA